ncbi:AAA family ATPase [Bauldia sp.]|uniref:AAA family ATPase n=1 Tax=Bauldia sp. TaxID=2575872 RepID=UPI003BA885FD
MGVRNYLIEGVSGTGKTAVCHELRRRGYHALNGDRDLAYPGDPETGKPVDRPLHLNEADAVAWVHAHGIWDIDKVRALAADRSHAASFFCGGSRNFSRFVDVFDRVFVLDIDRDTLVRRLARRPDDEFGGQAAERDLILRLHETKEDIPTGIVIDATAPLERVVDAILERCV